jgi:TetR/AcrR family transcriptional regulator, tetracycline repressor protein
MTLAREQIVDAAFTLLNAGGIDNVTTRKLAERLGVQQPALYWHFRNKSALLDDLNELMLARYHEHRLPAPGEAWDDFTIANARSFRRALLAVRDGARLNAGTRPSTRQFADAERHLELYVGAGFTPQQAFGITISLTRYVLGFVLEEQGERERADDEARAIDGDPLSEVAPFPILSAVLKPLIGAGTINTESVFERGLGYMVVGIRASLPARASAKVRRASPRAAPTRRP